MNELKRLAFAIGLLISLQLLVVSAVEEYEWWVEFLMVLPMSYYSIAFATRFWPIKGDKNAR